VFGGGGEIWRLSALRCFGDAERTWREGGNGGGSCCTDDAVGRSGEEFFCCAQASFVLFYYKNATLLARIHVGRLIYVDGSLPV
jgi:hypothetical protein